MSMVAEQSASAKSTSTNAADLLAQWRTEGYVLVRGLFDVRETAPLMEICDHARAGWARKDVTPGGQSPNNDDACSMRHLNHPDYFRDGPREREMLRLLLDTCGDPRVLDFAPRFLPKN